jgi:hypothetical protein
MEDDEDAGDGKIFQIHQQEHNAEVDEHDISLCYSDSEIDKD